MPEPGELGPIRLLTFGGMSLTNGAGPLVGAATQRRPLAVLAVLAVAGERGASRDRIQSLLWPDSDPDRARKVLAQTIYAIRRDLKDSGVVLGSTELRLNAEVVAADVVEFQNAVAAGAWERAAVLYTGPFLDGVHLPDAPEFERWAEGERDRLARTAREVLQRMALASEAIGEWEVAAGWWARLAALDPLSGRVAVRYMEALAAAGDVAAALRHARVHATLVRDELDVPADPSVTAMVERLRTPARPTTPVSVRAVGPTPTSPPVPSAIGPVAPPPTEGILPGAAATGNGLPPAGTATRGDGTLLSTAAPIPVESETPVDPSEPLDAVPVPEPSGRAPAAPGASSRRAGVGRRGTALGAAITLVAFAALAVLGGRYERSPLDQTMLAVIPFDVADPELRLWREGMVDVLSRNLDGAGPLRTASPTVVVREWTGRADRETVRVFARAAGAGTVVYGQLMRAGSDSVRASVTLLDVVSGRPLAEFRRQEAHARMDRLTDSVTVDVLRAMSRSLPVGAARAVPLGAVTSIEALRAFLQGEQQFRRASWSTAVEHYRRAVTLDSTFALAWRRLGLVASWQRLLQDSLTAAYLLRAGAANRGLGPRDSLLVVADSLSAAANTTPSSVEAFNLTRRLFATLDAAVQRYPADPEVWFAVGEARYHFGFGPGVGVSERATLHAFDRAIALDSAFVPAYIHAVELGFTLGGAPLGLRYARAYLARNPTEAAHRGVLLIEPLVDPARARAPAVERLLDTASASALVSARTILRRWPDSAETAVRLGRSLAAGRSSEYPLFADTTFMRRRLAEQLAFRGHLAEAYRVLGTRELPIFAELAYLGAVPSETARAVFDRWQRSNAGSARLALPWWSAQRDSASLIAFAEQAAARLAGGTDGVDLETRLAYDTTSARAHLALVRGDTVAALLRFLTLPDTVCADCYLDRLTRARLLLAAGRAHEALETLQEPLVAFLTPVEVLFALERSRAARRLGRSELAAEACAFARAAWRRGDPSARARVAAACDVR